jgi:uncharacterized protein GlcG (DUF336 family)
MSGLSLASARAIVAQALDHARAGRFKPLAVIALDARGALVAAAAEDGCSLGRWQVAFGKASGALFLGVGSRHIAAMAQERPHFTGSIAHLVERGMVPVAGGVLVRDQQGAVIGAVGVSGDTSDNDEAAARAGIEAAGFAPDGG